MYLMGKYINFKNMATSGDLKFNPQPCANYYYSGKEDYGATPWLNKTQLVLPEYCYKFSRAALSLQQG